MSELKRTNSEFSRPRPEKSVWAPSARAQHTAAILVPSTLGLEPSMELMDSCLRFGNDPYNSVGRRTRNGRSA
jgi:hypothetical protein